ncbi:MAG: MFS transporter [Cumulibacter sp.]
MGVPAVAPSVGFAVYLLLPYVTDTVGISALLAGVIVLAPKIWDVVTSPIIGRIGDRAVVRLRIVVRSQIAANLRAVWRTGTVPWPAVEHSDVESGQKCVVGGVSYSLCSVAVAVLTVPCLAMPEEKVDCYTSAPGFRPSASPSSPSPS